eukprot:tig00020934_g16123.t1
MPSRWRRPAVPQTHGIRAELPRESVEIAPPVAEEREERAGARPPRRSAGAGGEEPAAPAPDSQLSLDDTPRDADGAPAPRPAPNFGEFVPFWRKAPKVLRPGDRVWPAKRSLYTHGGLEYEIVDMYALARGRRVPVASTEEYERMRSDGSRAPLIVVLSPRYVGGIQIRTVHAPYDRLELRLRNEEIGYYLSLGVAVSVFWLSTLFSVRECISAYGIFTTSMVPTLLPGDAVLVDKISYRFRDPRRGEIVAFRPPPRLADRMEPATLGSRDVLVKRLVGVPGDEVEVRGGTVYVNGAPEPNPKAEPAAYEMAPEIVPPGQYFVLGDNVNRSVDSHVWGPLPRSKLVGRACGRWWPLPRLTIGGL